MNKTLLIILISAAFSINAYAQSPSCETDNGFDPCAQALPTQALTTCQQVCTDNGCYQSCSTPIPVSNSEPENCPTDNGFDPCAQAAAKPQIVCEQVCTDNGCYDHCE